MRRARIARRLTVRFAAALALGSAPIVQRAALAQLILPTPGARVRVTAPDFALRADAGLLVRATPDSVTIAFAGGRSEVTIPIDRLTRLEMSTGKRRAAGVAQGAGYGTVVGTFVGIGAGAAMYFFNCNTEELCGLWFLVTIPGGAGAGLIIGSVVGAVRAPDRWEEISLPRQPRDMGMLAPSRNAKVGLTIPF